MSQPAIVRILIETLEAMLSEVEALIASPARYLDSAETLQGPCPGQYELCDRFYSIRKTLALHFPAVSEAVPTRPKAYQPSWMTEPQGLLLREDLHGLKDEIKRLLQALGSVTDT
jgi:hypothetical protein